MRNEDLNAGTTEYVEFTKFNESNEALDVPKVVMPENNDGKSGDTTREGGTTDALKTFLRRIWSIPVFSREQEKELGRELIKARQVIHGLEKTDSRELQEAKTNLKEIEKKFVVHNIRLVLFLIWEKPFRKYQLSDLIQEGTIALHRAVE